MIGRTLRLYAPSVVLALWALVWVLGLTGDGVVVAGLLLTAVAVVLHVCANHGGGHAAT